MSFSTEVRQELEKLKVWDNQSQLKQEDQIKRLCVREAFLEYGFITDPNKKSHLEFVFKQKQKAEQIKSLLEENGISAKILERANKYMLYMKDSEEIANLLALIGAQHSVIKYEEIQVLKDTKNNINRIVNCESANMDKIINASVKQIEAIDYLIKTKEIENLPLNLQEIAKVRKENPDASLEELGSKLAKPIGKSGANHRLKKIVEIADELRKG